MRTLFGFVPKLVIWVSVDEGMAARLVGAEIVGDDAAVLAQMSWRRGRAMTPKADLNETILEWLL